MKIADLESNNMKYSILVIFLFVFFNLSYADKGKLILQNGKVFTGDIKKTSDGSYWVYDNKCMIKFTKDEIKKAVIYSKDKHNGQNAQKAVGVKLNTDQYSVCKDESKYDDIINSAARKHNLDPALVKAVVKAESNFNAMDLSYKGAQGLMQLMPDTAKGLGVKNSYEPSANINAGTKYLRYMLEMFNWDLEKALAAYNAGPGAVLKYHKVPPFQETKGYVKNVYKNYQDYRYSNKIYTYTDESGNINIYNVKRK